MPRLVRINPDPIVDFSRRIGVIERSKMNPLSSSGAVASSIGPILAQILVETNWTWTNEVEYQVLVETNWTWTNETEVT